MNSRTVTLFATAVAMKAIEQEVARLKLTEEEVYEKTEVMISSVQREIKKLIELGFIQEPPDIA